MCSNLEKLLRNAWNLFLKQVIDKYSTPIQLKEIDLHKKDNLLKGKSIKLDFAAEIRPVALQKKDMITNTDIERLHKDHTNLYLQLVEKFMEWTPLGSIIVRISQVLNPNALMNMLCLQKILSRSTNLYWPIW